MRRELNRSFVTVFCCVRSLTSLMYDPHKWLLYLSVRLRWSHAVFVFQLYQRSCQNHSSPRKLSILSFFGNPANKGNLWFPVEERFLNVNRVINCRVVFKKDLVKSFLNRQILFEKDHIQANNITDFRFHEAQDNINAFVYWNINGIGLIL